MAFLDQRRWTIDVAAQLAHGALRYHVMGDRALSREAATEDDLRQMMAIAVQSSAAGAVGFFTSRVMLHKSRSGECVPNILPTVHASALPHVFKMTRHIDYEPELD